MTDFEVNDLSQALFEEAGDALFLVDPEEDRVLDANPTALRLSSFSRQELLRLSATYLFRSDGKGGQFRLKQATQRTGVFHSQEGYFLRTRNDGGWVPVNLTVARLHVRGVPVDWPALFRKPPPRPLDLSTYPGAESGTTPDRP